MNATFYEWSDGLLPELRSIILQSHASSCTRLLLGMTCTGERALCRRDREPPLVEALIMDGQHELLVRLGLSLRAYCCEYCRWQGSRERVLCETLFRLVHMAVAGGHVQTLEFLYESLGWWYFHMESVYLAIEHAQWRALEWLLSVVNVCGLLQVARVGATKGAETFIAFHKPHLLHRYVDYMRDRDYGALHPLWPHWCEEVNANDWCWFAWYYLRGCFQFLK